MVVDASNIYMEVFMNFDDADIISSNAAIGTTVNQGEKGMAGVVGDIADDSHVEKDSRFHCQF